MQVNVKPVLVEVEVLIKTLTESWKYGLVIDDDITSDTYGCIIKLYDFDEDSKQ